MQRRTPRVDDAPEATTFAHERARRKAARSERVKVEDALRLGIRVEQDLKPAIEQKAVDRVCGDTSADAVGRLEQRVGNT